MRANGPNAWIYQIGADQLADTSNDDKLQGGVAAAHPGDFRQCADRPVSGAEGCQRTGDPVSGLGPSLGHIARYCQKKTRDGFRLVQQPVRRSMVACRKEDCAALPGADGFASSVTRPRPHPGQQRGFAESHYPTEYRSSEVCERAGGFHLGPVPGCGAGTRCADGHHLF